MIDRVHEASLQDAQQSNQQTGQPVQQDAQPVQQDEQPVGTVESSSDGQPSDRSKTSILSKLLLVFAVVKSIGNIKDKIKQVRSGGDNNSNSSSNTASKDVVIPMSFIVTLGIMLAVMFIPINTSEVYSVKVLKVYEDSSFIVNINNKNYSMKYSKGNTAPAKGSTVLVRRAEYLMSDDKYTLVE